MVIKGKVIRGKQEGTKLGFPTANVQTKQKTESGIYVGYALIDQDNSTKYEAVFYVSAENPYIVECHLLDFATQDLYNQEITADIVYKQRGVVEFSSLDEAASQIKQDIIKAKQWFTAND